MTLGDLIVRIGADISGFVTAMKSVVDQVDDAAEKVESRLESIGNVGQRLAEVGAEMTAAITLPLEEIGRRALETAATFEQTQVAFTTFLGSAAEAHAMLGQLYNFAATTPFQIGGVLQGSRTLLAMGFAAKDIVPILRTLGDAASGLGVGQAGLERFVFHLGQIRALGHIDGMILRELGQNGIAAAQMIADYMGKSVPEITKMVTAKDPKLDADTVINALMRGMNAQFGGGMKDQMQTLGGMWSNFKDQITLAAVQIGNVLLPAGKALLEIGTQILTLVKEMSDWFAALPAPIQGAAIALAAMAAAAGPVLVAIGGIGMLLPGIVAVITPLAGALGISVVALGGWAVAIAAALAALAALGTWIFAHWEGVKAAASQVFSGIADIWNATLGVAINWVKDKIQAFVEWSSPVWQFFGGAIKEVWQALADYVHTIWDGLKHDVFDPMMAWLKSIPGVSAGIAKIAGAGSAFDKGEEDKKDRDTIRAAESTMHLGANAFQVTPQAEAWDEKHKHQIEQYQQALATLRQEHEKGKVSTEELTEAERAYQQLLAQKPPKFGAPEKEKKGDSKLDHNALDALSGIKAHEEALLNLQRAAIEHQYQMSQMPAMDKTRFGEADAEAEAQREIAAAEKRRQALDAISLKERDEVVQNINDKLKLYKGEQSGYEKLVAAKTAAEDKYQAELQKNKFAEESVLKRVNEQKEAEERRHHNEVLKEARQHADAMASLQQSVAQMQEQHAQSIRGLREKEAQLRLDLGEITKAQYLAIKQREIDEAYAMELKALDDEQRLLDEAYARARAEANTPEEKQRIDDDFGKRQVVLTGKRQQTMDRHASDTQGVQIEQTKDTYDTIFKPLETSGASALTGLIEGTKTLGQAWRGVVTGMLGSWIQTLSQMAARWVAHKAMELLLHVSTNHAKLASDTVYTGQSYILEFGLYLKKQLLKALDWILHLGHNARKIASDAATNAVSVAQAATAALAKQAIVTPINVALALSYAGLAAAGAFADNIMLGIPIATAMGATAYGIGSGFAGLAAFEQGGLVPGTGLAMLHGGEMVLPQHLSESIQAMVALSGRMLQNPEALTRMPGGEMKAVNELRDSGSGFQSGDINHHWGGVTMHVHNSKADPLTEDKVFDAFQRAVRRRNMKMA